MKSLLTFLLLVAFITSCAVRSQQETQPPSPEVTLDEQLIEINKRIPGFGGLFIDENGDVNVYVVGVQRLDETARQAKQAEVEKALVDILGAEYLSPTAQRRAEQEQKLTEKRAPRINVVQGDYEILQLAKWRASIDSALGVPGVVFTDLDEQANRLKIGIEAGVSREKIEGSLRKSSIPLNAVVFEETKPVYFHASLRDKFRSTPGGVQVEADTGVFSYKICTMGFNAIRAGVNGFVTNSHCTKTQGGSEGTDFHQPNDPWWTEGNKVGDEIADPTYFTGGNCPSGRRCRFSDSAFIDYRIALGRDIARTTGWNNGSLTINSSNTRLNIVDEMSSWVDGSELDKIGRTTGWTYGRVNGTCQNTNVAGTDITLLCQHRVNRLPAGTYTMSDNGDSGSPVFRWLGTTVVLSGILWGGPDDGSSFVFSPMSQIERELGVLTTFAFP